MGCGGAALLACRGRGEGGRVRDAGAGAAAVCRVSREGRSREGLEARRVCVLM